MRRPLAWVAIVTLTIVAPCVAVRTEANPTASPAPTPTPCYGAVLNSPLPSLPPADMSGTMPPDAPSVNDPNVQQAINQGNQLAQQQGYDTTETPQPNTTPHPCPSLMPTAGDLLERIWAAASSYRGQSTAIPGTSCSGHGDGWCACAAAVQHVVYLATGKTIGDYAVDDWRNLAFSGQYGGGIVPAALAHRGAIIIWPSSSLNEGNNAHIGICATDQCTVTWSNSSSQAKFAPYDASISFNGAFSSWLIWEPSNI